MPGISWTPASPSTSGTPVGSVDYLVYTCIPFSLLCLLPLLPLLLDPCPHLVLVALVAPQALTAADPAPAPPLDVVAHWVAMRSFYEGYDIDCFMKETSWYIAILYHFVIYYIYTVLDVDGCVLG